MKLRSKRFNQSTDQPINISAYLLSFLTAAFFTTGALAGLLLPKDPLKIFPFFVFLSPLPIYIFLVFKIYLRLLAANML
jgi:hypothetical protein